MSERVKPSTNPKHDYAFQVTVDAILNSMHVDRAIEGEDSSAECYCDEASKIGGVCYCCSVDNDDSPYNLKF